MEAILYSPPVIFILFFFIIAMSSRWLSKFSKKGKSGDHALDSYACGQRDVQNYVNPDYGQFYLYAFVFTVVHVLILVVATVPANVQFLPVAYIIAGILAILIIFKR
jgi:NADH:ubiquinone oxidoreductase subunit 3 (subunit A)